jgi:predicted nucleic acid-binding protein
VTGLLDASVVIRYLTNDHPEMVESASRLLRSDQTLVLTGVTIMEIGYVLTRTYAIPRAQVVDSLADLMSSRNIETRPADKPTMLSALALCRNSGRVSFADAMLWAHARATGEQVYTFDARFPTTDIEVLVPS